MFGKESIKGEWERNGTEQFYFLSRSSNFCHPFSPFLAKIVKNWWKKWRNGENGWKDVETGRGAILALSRFSNLARFRFLYRLKPVLDSFQNPFLPLFVTVLGLSCIDCLSYLDTRCFNAPHWPTSDHYLSVDEWEVYICCEEMLGICSLAPTCCGSKWSDSATKPRAQGAPHAKKRRRLKGPDKRIGRTGGGET